MIDMKEILNIEPYGLNAAEKKPLFDKRIRELTLLHSERCREYNNIIKAFSPDDLTDYENVVFLPTRLFKNFDLKSIADSDVFKIMTSSGTSGQSVSKIFLDKSGAAMQQKVLSKIVTSFTGKKRLPMIILDSPSVVKSREMFSARGAGIIGFSIFGSDKIYAFDDNMQIDFSLLKAFLERHKGENIFLFGFTFMVWKYFYKAIARQNEKLDLSRGILIHGGGWKKLKDEAVSNDDFKQALYESCGIKRVYNYYGMVEQTGCIYMECEYGHLHASVFSDIVIRDWCDFSPKAVGETGIVEAISLLPESYPGHCLLTEDEGTLLGIDDCPCGRKGKYFAINGRLKQAEIRGCSDTYGK
jgi:phenylacetate-coenzyme A ligase PaaK-like adenylate-forming protein